MADYTPKAEKQLTNTSRSLEALSSLAPDADPAVLMATADEIAKLAEVIRNIKELGLVFEVAGAIELNNGVIISLALEDNREGEEYNG